MTAEPMPLTPWDRAILALTLLGIDPAGLGGMIVRVRIGPVRDAFAEGLAALAQPIIKLHPAMDDDVLFGGIDLTETLNRGTVVQRKGILSRDGTPVLTMAERCDVTLAARLSIALDAGTMTSLIALDEGAEPDEQTPPALRERMAFYADMDIPLAEVGLLADETSIAEAQRILPDVGAQNDTYETLIGLCAQLGIHSQRAPLFALRAARAHAALNGRLSVEPQDIEIAAALCLAHKATVLPPPPAQEEADTELADHQEPTEAGGDTNIGPLDDRILEAVMAVLPDGLLDQFKPKGSISKGSGAGAKNRSNRRGRPKPSRAGRLSGRNRLDLIATLRTAAPWQRLRSATAGRVKVIPSDFRIKHYEEKSDRLLIFTVDASGSAAMSRLAEAASFC